MLLAGYETTANALTFAIYLLSRPCNAEKQVWFICHFAAAHLATPRVPGSRWVGMQAKVLAEVDALVKSQPDYSPSYEDVEQKLPYLDAVLKEALRLYPPAHTLLRQAVEDTEVGGERPHFLGCPLVALRFEAEASRSTHWLRVRGPAAGYKVRRGQWLVVPVYSIHNDPNHWPEADKFMPERWLTGDPAAAKQAKICFMGFGEGARACPGSRFALTEAKVALLRIYSAFTLQLAPYQVPMPDTCSLCSRVAPLHRHLHVLRPSQSPAECRVERVLGLQCRSPFPCEPALP